jgi:DNA invertase Pin-like site-specific DNA recombinase
MQVMDGYIRVSRVMGREGDSYMSPSIQEDDIKRWAEARGVSLGKIAKDEDVSGGKAIAARGLGGLIDRIEAGVSSGVIVNHLDRFGRDALDAAIAIKRIHDAGGRLVATSTGTDSSQPDAKMILNFYFMMAEAYLDRTKASWDATKRRNVEERSARLRVGALRLPARGQGRGVGRPSRRSARRGAPRGRDRAAGVQATLRRTAVREHQSCVRCQPGASAVKELRTAHDR